MVHCILVKFISGFNLVDHLDDIKRIFDSIDVPGKSGVDYIKNCVGKENRWHFLIRIHFPKDSLSAYDSSSGHKEWKEKYGQFVEKKAIFDYEE